MVYLLHFSAPISPRHSCQHYLGYAGDLASRLAEHKAGRGARLTQVALERGITWELARTWQGDRALERQLKNRKGARVLCPICNPRPLQLALDLPEPDPFEVPAPAYRPDGLEWAYRKAAERARPLSVLSFDGQSDNVGIPF